MSNKVEKFLKDPDADLPYGWDWGKEWLEEGDVIVASTWEVETGITKISDSHNGYITFIWLSGGTVGETYTLTNRVLTQAGQKDERTFRVKVVER